ncbi:MAG: hypothetical protein IJI37_05160 [Opitutales bacterium]|nr:hypothetical protein [Opitutales bacterium]
MAESGKARSFGEGTAPFDAALEKISKGLVEVLYSQFGSRPAAFVAGAIAEEPEETAAAPGVSESAEESFEMPADYEEDDND